MRSENYISGNRNIKKSILILILIFTAIVTVIGVFALWSFYSCARAGIVKDTSLASILLWFSSSFSVPLCPFDAYTVKFILSRFYVVLIADVAVAFCLLLAIISNGKFKGNEHGSAHWANKQELKTFSKKENNMPLADGVYLTKEAEAFIVDSAYDPIYGARPLKRFMQKTVETLAARLILCDGVSAGDTIVVDVENGVLKARRED